MPSFYNGKRFFLTYPRCDSAPVELQQFLQSVAPTKYVLVAREKHQDGAFHLHACVEFRTVQRHNVQWLDFAQKHPNKQDPRKWDACRTYCKKDGDFVETEAGDEDSGDSVRFDLSTLCLSYSDEAEWLSYCVSEKIAFQYARWFWERLHGDVSTILGDDHDGQMCPSLVDFQYDWSKTLILKGPSGCGKTTWAKKSIPKPALFVTHADELKTFKAGYHVSIIFDDVDFNHWPRTSQIALVDTENPRQIHCRYSVARIPAGVCKVFTCNIEPVSCTDDAVRRRTRVVNVHQ